VNRFTDHLQIITTYNYNTTADFHTKYSQCTFNSLYLITALNKGYSSTMFSLDYNTQSYKRGIRPRFHTGSNSSCMRSSLYSLGEDPQKTPLPLLLGVDSLLQRCVYRSCIATSAVPTQKECRLQYLFYCCMMSQRT
jgi:hypothetical protein